MAHLTNGLNCQNCHLQAGTQGFANNYLAVAATYPKLRARSPNKIGRKKLLVVGWGIGLPVPLLLLWAPGTGHACT